MSFIQSICGPATSNEFVFSTSNVSSDNASFINLSVLGDATIVTLSTTNFSPTTLDAQVLTAVNGTIATFQSTSSYISNLSVSSMSVDNLSVGEVDITLLDVETIEVDRLKIMDSVNSNYSQLVRASDVMTIAGGYVDPLDPTVIYEGQINLTSGAGAARAINISLDKANISGNVIDAITTNSVSVNASDLYSDSVIAIDVDADEGNFGTVNTPFLNVSTLGVSDIVTENISVINASVNNLSVYNTLDIKDRDGSNHHGSIYNDSTGLHIAGNGELIRIRSGGAFDEIVVTKTSGRVNISNLNTSTITGIDVTLTGTMDATTVIANDINTPLLNASNISIDEDISCEQIVCADVICNDVTTNFLFDVDLTNNLSAGQGITITSVDSVAVISATTSITDPLNISKLNASNISVDVNMSVTGSFTCNDAQIDDLFNCDMTNTLRGGTSGIDIPFDNISVNFDTGTHDTTVMLKPGIVLYNISLLPNILTLAPPTFEMTTGTAQITNANMSNLSVNHLSVINDISVPSAIITDVTTNGISLAPDQVGAPPTFEMTTGTAQITNANMSNLSVNNLSVLTDITTPAATITNLTVPAGGIFNHDFSQNISAGQGISIAQVGNKAVITNTGVTDPLNISKLNVSNISVDEGITTDTITCDLTPNLTIGANMSILSVNNKPLIGLNPDINISNLSTISTSVNNISVAESITVGTPGVASGIYAKNGSGVFSTGGFYFNNKPDGTGGNFNIFWIGGNVSAYGIGTLDGHDIRLANGYNTGGLVVDGIINNINMSNCSINNLSLDTLTCDLTSNLTAGTGITITSVGGKPTISSLGGGVADPLNISKINASNISVENMSTLTFSSTQLRFKDPTDPDVTKGVVFCNPIAFQYYGPNHVFFNNTVVPNVEYMRMDSTLSNVNISNLSTTNTSILNDATITRDLKVQRYLDAGKPTFILLRRSANTALSSGAIYAIFNQNTSAQINGEFSTSGGTTVIVATGGWYRVSWALGYKRVSNTGGDRAAIRSYLEANGSFDSFKNTISSSCYIRRTNLCREGHITGYNFLYIPANGYVRLRQQCMVEGSSTWNSNLSGLELRGSSNFMVELVSSASET